MSEYNENVPQPSENQPQQGGNEPGKGAAIGSLVCGIVAVVFWFFGVTSIGSVILGIVGLILAANAKKAGFKGGMQTAGFVLSLLGLILGAIIFIACVACAGGLACVGAFSELG